MHSDAPPVFSLVVDDAVSPGDVVRPLASLLLHLARKRLAAKQSAQPMCALPDQGTLSEAIVTK
jgi:hypothetical protein